MTQTEMILAALRSGESLTPLQALDRFGCFRLAARISDAKALLRDDEEIVTERLTTGGATVARYALRRRTVPAGQATLWETETRR